MNQFDRVNLRKTIWVDWRVFQSRGLNWWPQSLVINKALGLVDGGTNLDLAVDRLEHVIVQTLASELDLEEKKC